MKRGNGIVVLLGVIAASFACCIFASSNASAVTSIEAVYEQAWSSKEGNLKILDTLKPTDVVLNPHKLDIYGACAEYISHWNNGNGDPSKSTRIIWHGKGKFNDYFSCQKRTYDKDDLYNLPFDGENWGEGYSITTQDRGGTPKEFDYNDSDVAGPDSNGVYPSFTVVSPGAAVDVVGGKTYDLHMTLYDIKVKIDKPCDTDDGNATVVALLYGWTTDQSKMKYHKDMYGYSYFLGQSLIKKARCRGGALYKVKIELYDGNTKVNGKRLLWAVNDIDIGDRFYYGSDGKTYTTNQEYNPYNWQYAEHFRFLRDENNDIYGATEDTYISMVDILDGKSHDGCSRKKRDEQELAFEYDAIFHNIKTSGGSWNHCVDNDDSGSTNDNSTSALFVIDSTDFRFEWGGSKCGTTIDSAPYSEFGGKTVIKYNGDEVESGTVKTVHGSTSGTISFDHYIRREFGTAEEETELFTVIRNDWKFNPGNRNSVYDGSFDFKLAHKDTYQRVYTTTGTDYNNTGSGYRATLSPGQTKTYTHELKFQHTSVSNSSAAFDTVGEKSITVKRPPATFTATVTPTVKNGSTNATINSNKRVKITDPDGKYTVDFAYTIARDNDTSGDTVETPWNTNLTKNGNIPSPSYEASGTANRTEGQSKGDDITGQTYTGNLRYGESITFCGNIHYKSIIDASRSDDTGRTVSECVTVWRDNATCDFFPEFQYGLENASNVGRIGVNNYTLVGNQDNPTYTVPYTTPDVSIFARPGDSVRFYLQMCAGTLYPIREKNMTNKTVTYKASGESTKLSGDGNGYLFRQSVSVVDGSFFNPRIWTSANDGHNYNFLRDKNLIGDFWSPNGQAEKKYRCGAVGDMENGHYQIAGKLNCGRSENPAYDIGVIDVGSTITQKLEWDEMTYANGAFDNSRNAHRVATASVVTPYNYVLKPYVTNGGGGNKVAYLGETAKMSPGVVVTARKNTAFPNGKQTYATITKPTDINVKYYFTTASGSVIAEAAVPESSRSGARLNPNGSNGGTGLSDIYSSAIESGGTLLPEVDVPIPENTVHVGDKVCVEVSVYPADSHDDPNATTVLGGGNNGEALKETSNGSNWATAVSCSTIAKKPTMSVESSNAYSATEFKTAQYARNNGGKMFNFGSWSEYGVFGRVNTGASIFVSGAALGYSRDGYPASRAANAPRANDAASADNKKVSTKTNSDKCTFMTQTFANAECNPGYSKIGGVMATQYEQRIKERYSSDAGTFSVAGLGVKSFDSVNYYDVSGYNGSDVIVEPSGILRFDSKNNLYIASLPNVSNAQFAEKGIERPNRTIVYSAPNKNIVIDGNLNYDSGAKGAIDDLTQVIIIAKNVYFTNTPTYTNAIIIAESVNTCKYATDSKVAVGGKGGTVTIDSNICSQALRFDSPVIVKKLILNRTAGADNGENAIRRAEIFNLNMANFLWSFNQMSRLSQATTTYSRELPTRY